MLQVLNLLWGSSNLRNPSAYIVSSGNILLDEHYREQEQREAQERSDAELAAGLMQKVSRTVCVDGPLGGSCDTLRSPSLWELPAALMQ